MKETIQAEREMMTREALRSAMTMMLQMTQQVNCSHEVVDP
jgi:hypothetical protein